MIDDVTLANRLGEGGSRRVKRRGPTGSSKCVSTLAHGKALGCRLECVDVVDLKRFELGRGGISIGNW